MAARILNGPRYKTPNFLSDINLSVGQYLWKILQQNTKNRECLINAHTGERYNLREIKEHSVNLATYLQNNLKCGPDTIVGIISDNRKEYLAATIATFFVGATLTCFNPQYTIGELEHTFGISQPSILFCSSMEKIEKLAKSFSTLQHIIVFDNDERTPVSALLFENLIKPTQAKLQVVHMDPECSTAILYSSGTTGFPKGVLITNRNIVFQLKYIREENAFGVQKHSTLITFMPMFHVYGLFLMLISIMMEIRSVFLRKFDEIVYLQCIERYKVKYLILVPPIIMFLLKDWRVDDFDLSSVEKICSAGAALKPETEKAIKKKLRLRTFWQAYGMTESTLFCTCRNKRSWKTGTSGSVICGAQIKIIDITSGEILPPNQPGEICIKGLNVTKGYYKNEEATAATFDKDGWLRTGDIGYYDDDDDIFIVDRLKELIKYNVYQVSPAEIESVLMKHESVQDAAVIGVPNDFSGEIPTAFVVKKPQSTISEKELVDYAAALLSPQKKLRGGIIFIEQIPKNASGKILRRKLKEMYLCDIKITILKRSSAATILNQETSFSW